MGCWNITIRGIGAHHNPDYPADADKMAKEFVRQLKSKGHTITSASITYGGDERLDEPQHE
ncbi:MAG TPA: hypothetical protein VM577_07020 [Anaerovoracaceae bacterium]|nr:hypothetical protein [Anaerovoracaceae bacterium]